MSLLFLGLASFAQVFTLGFQSRCVNAGNYGLAFICSTFIGFSQVYVWHHVISAEGFLPAAVYSISGAFAICAAIWAHKKMHGRHLG